MKSKNFLHLTNGEYTAQLIKKSHCGGDVLSINDVFYEGPVPAVNSMSELNIIRAKYLSDVGYGEYTAILEDMTRQNEILNISAQYDEIILWFEHDLYDQLQLIFLLNWYAQQNLSTTALKLICIDRYPGVTPFYGLGQLTPLQIDELFFHRERISDQQLELGSRAWKAFTNSNPLQLQELLKADLSCLTYFKNALVRLLQEFPALENGLSRTEKFILLSVNQQPSDLSTIFQQLPLDEGQHYMGLGDLCFWTIAKSLAQENNPLITLSAGNREINRHSLHLYEITASLTDLGRDILNNKADWILLNGIDRWLGGVHLTPDNCWRWDERTQTISREKA